MSEIQKWTIHEPYLAIGGTLLEGPYHDAAINEFRFIDIWDHKLYRLDLARGPESLRVIETEDSIGVTANIAGETDQDDLIVGAKHGFARLNRTTGRLSYIREAWDDHPDRTRMKHLTPPKGDDVALDLTITLYTYATPTPPPPFSLCHNWTMLSLTRPPFPSNSMRFNDGAVDSHGRFWAGTMNDPKVQAPRAEGTLFRLDPDLNLHAVVPHATIPNGIGWSPDEATMYWTDSATHCIFAFDFDAATGMLSRRRVLVNVGEGLEPDGLAVDEAGNLWSAIYGGSRILRVSPKGEVTGVVEVPTKNPTCVAFVGTELWITSAADGRNVEEGGESVKMGGCVFRVDVGVRGLPKHEFRFE
ncbi:hypothetical protein N7462_008422 [Penicillium macrosclerotiorum]|uniref:uncharacterized protein n=1 Tax=Penicillium macrosclerotiorum TaxID=303699 RepID=UPI002547A82B|nr:uncharacterized protein N7462_008422 [Penicillium macrosclerotiorum]KAJ5675525.1 hypothetical protein N7462_008422 [Penicillium macrosclerotiorum]